jgi:DNA repair exonuclease SbcCD ATPase subunit
MLEDIQSQLGVQQQTLMELEEELELEISRVIQLKNKLEPDLIEELEKIEEGLYVEVKMIHETKLSVNTIMEKIKNDINSNPGVIGVDQKNIELTEAELEKYKKRSEKLVKQLIQANEEIEELTNKMESKMKEREGEMKNELINKLKDKERIMNEKLFQTQRRVEELNNQLEAFKRQPTRDPEELERMKVFFDKKIKNLKKTMTDEFKKREREIALKAIVVYNKKKENIYKSVLKELLNSDDHSPESETFLFYLRSSLDLADDVYSIENFSLCNFCGEVVHISQSNCPNCNMSTV